MQLAAFTLLWIALTLYALLAGADFGVGLWVLVSRASKNGRELRATAFSYFSPLWEVNGLFLIFFLMGLFTAFPPALALLGRTLLPLVLAALVLFVLRGGFYVLLEHGPERARPLATWAFGLTSVATGVVLGYAAAAPASGWLSGGTLHLRYYASAIGIASIPLTLAASAHLSALALAAHARLRQRSTSEWFRLAGIASGLIALGAAGLFTLAIIGHAAPTRAHLLGPRGLPLLAAALLLAGGLVALARSRYRAAVLLTGSGYLAGLLGGAYAQLPYLIYPALTLHQAASPHPTLTAFVAASAIGLPLLLVAIGLLYWLTLRPGQAEAILESALPARPAPRPEEV